MSAKVVSSSENLAGREILKITSRVDATPLKEVENGTIIPFYGYVEQEIINDKTGETFNSVIVASKNDDGFISLYATRSESFCKALYEIINVLQETGDAEPFSIEICKQKSKNGREFVTCCLA